VYLNIRVRYMFLWFKIHSNEVVSIKLRQFVRNLPNSITLHFFEIKIYYFPASRLKFAQIMNLESINGDSDLRDPFFNADVARIEGYLLTRTRSHMLVHLKTRGNDAEHIWSIFDNLLSLLCQATLNYQH
jgi:hypothetical protein